MHYIFFNNLSGFRLLLEKPSLSCDFKPEKIDMKQLAVCLFLDFEVPFETINMTFALSKCFFSWTNIINAIYEYL